MTSYLEKPIEGYEGLYAINTNCEVISLERTVDIPTRGIRRRLKRRVLRPALGSTGYRGVALHNQKQKTHSIYRLMAETFIPNPDSLPEVNHKNGNKLDDSLENLEWCSYSHNLQHAYDTGLRRVINGEDRVNSKLTEADVVQIIELLEYMPHMKGKLNRPFPVKWIGKAFGVAFQTIECIASNRTWKHIPRSRDLV